MQNTIPKNIKVIKTIMAIKAGLLVSHKRLSFWLSVGSGTLGASINKYYKIRFKMTYLDGTQLNKCNDNQNHMNLYCFIKVKRSVSTPRGAFPSCIFS